MLDRERMKKKDSHAEELSSKLRPELEKLAKQPAVESAWTLKTLRQVNNNELNSF